MDIFGSRNNVVRTYYSGITKDGDLTLPEECLKGIALADGECTVIVTNSPKEYILCLYTLDSFADVRKNLESLNSMDPAVRSIKRRIIGEAEEVVMDKSGHIRIGPEFLMRLCFASDWFEKRGRPAFTVVLTEYPDRIEIGTPYFI